MYVNTSSIVEYMLINGTIEKHIYYLGSRKINNLSCPYVVGNSLCVMFTMSCSKYIFYYISVL